MSEKEELLFKIIDIIIEKLKLRRSNPSSENKGKYIQT